MIRNILLDAGPLGTLSNPKPSSEVIALGEWVESLIEGGVNIIIPEIADFEVRRELLRAEKVKGLYRLDVLKEQLFYLPITTEAMLIAAEFWATARRGGFPTAGNAALDADVILAAQTATISDKPGETLLATTNVGHLGRFIDARLWSEIPAP